MADPHTTPLYQPGDTKLLRVTLSQAEWFKLATLAAPGDLTLEKFVNQVVKDAAQ